MDLLWTAFVIGLVGSVHCAGMCGPLAFAVPAVGNSRISFTTGRLLYNAGRISTYCLIGVLFGALGRAMALSGFQRWVSLGAGMVLLLGLALSSRASAKLPVSKAVARLKRVFGSLLHRRTYTSLFLLGFINGLLPCGLVYAAAAGATATGRIETGIIYMAAFGLGTTPVMLGIGIAGPRIQSRLHFKLQRLIPISVTCLALLLVLRGMALGIPYLSPNLQAAPPLEQKCH